MDDESATLNNILDDEVLTPNDNGVALDEAPDLSFGQVSVYVVRKGDTISDIAKMFKVSKNTILWNNDIKNNSITSGQELIILPVSGIKHKIKNGETINSIAKQHNGDVAEILAYNHLSVDDKLVVGNEIIVPDGEAKKSEKIGDSSLPRLAAQLSRIRLPDGYLLRPVSKFVRTQGIHGYNGVDMAAPIGTPVYAAHDGKVITSKMSGWNAGYGNYVVIEHEKNVQTLYAHLNSVAVSSGDVVSKGDIIGYVGNTGKSTGPHLHFEVRGAYNPF